MTPQPLSMIVDQKKPMTCCHPSLCRHLRSAPGPPGKRRGRRRQWRRQWRCRICAAAVSTASRQPAVNNMAMLYMDSGTSTIIKNHSYMANNNAMHSGPFKFFSIFGIVISLGIQHLDDKEK